MSKTTTEYDTLCSTVKGREKCVARIKLLAEKYGATVQMHEFNGVREIGLDICFGPYACMMHFDGSTRVGAFLGHWHTNSTPGTRAKYPTTFASAIRGSLNEYHCGKATTCETTWHGFLISLERGLEALTLETA